MAISEESHCLVKGLHGYLEELYAGFKSSLARTRSLNHGKLLRESDMVGKLHRKDDIY